MPHVTYKGNQAGLGHAPSPGSGQRYMFNRGIPNMVTDEVDIATYEDMASNNPETWEVKYLPRECAADYVKEFVKKVKRKSLDDLKVGQARKLAVELEVDSAGNKSELLTAIEGVM